MEINEGVIRDQQGIYAGLLQSQRLHRQLAVCYNSDGKLLVKISMVKDITRSKEGMLVTLGSPDETRLETIIPFEHIQSIYPIRDFIE